jgi:glutathione synthase/RimK-type ligase-like ATP-grasp enzyme
MKLCVISPKICKDSAKVLADNVKAFRSNPYAAKRTVYTDFDFVFNFGCKKDIKYKRIINKPSSVKLCANKIETYKVLKENKIPTVSYVLNQKDVPKSWNWVVCREKVDGRNCEGVLITRPYDLVDNCPLYTKFFPHDEEYRIVVFNKKVVARFKKGEEQDGLRELIEMQPRGFKELDEACVKACEALDIDYAGVDVLCKETTGKYVVLEVNSGGMLNEEVLPTIVNYIQGLK